MDLGDAIEHRQDGPISIKGDPNALQRALKKKGISSVRTKDGVLIGKSQATRARELFDS